MENAVLDYWYVILQLAIIILCLIEPQQQLVLPVVAVPEMELLQILLFFLAQLMTTFHFLFCLLGYLYLYILDRAIYIPPSYRLSLRLIKLTI
ncbi:hypothetical protein QE439_003279 [Pedobacter agri]|nr:hypothetical protein [Pedobacter agri]